MKKNALISSHDNEIYGGSALADLSLEGFLIPEGRLGRGGQGFRGLPYVT